MQHYSVSHETNGVDEIGEDFVRKILIVLQVSPHPLPHPLFPSSALQLSYPTRNGILRDWPAASVIGDGQALLTLPRSYLSLRRELGHGGNKIGDQSSPSMRKRIPCNYAYTVSI